MAAPAQAAPTGCVSHVYALGNAGTCVKRLQVQLNWFSRTHGVTPLVADGIFGPKTRAAVIAFQTQRKLKVDGIVGHQTWYEVCSPHMSPGPGNTWPYANASALGCASLYAQ